MEAWLVQGMKLSEVQTVLFGPGGERCGSESAVVCSSAGVCKGLGRAGVRLMGRPALPGCRSASVSTGDSALLCSKSPRDDLFLFGCVSSANQTPDRQAQESLLLEPPLFGQAGPVRLFISFKLPGPRAFLKNSFFQRFFFFPSFFLPLPTFCLRENEMSIFCFLIFFQESKGLLTSSLSPPFLPSSRRYSSEKKRTKYCSCSLS